jgi:hypothetical protein
LIGGERTSSRRQARQRAPRPGQPRAAIRCQRAHPAREEVDGRAVQRRAQAQRQVGLEEVALGDPHAAGRDGAGVAGG